MEPFKTLQIYSERRERKIIPMGNSMQKIDAHPCKEV